MKSLSILLLFLTAFTGAMAQEETCSENTIVRLTTGMTQGEIQNGIYVYKGLPYARADRFMPPELPDSWEGVRNFTEYGHICPQAPMPAENDFYFESEDSNRRRRLPELEHMDARNQ